jgi:hypothetical protein
MQFADLMKLFREGQNEGRKRGYVTQGACDAEGIRRVVEALRDEMRTPRYSSWEDIDDFLTEILAIAGVDEKAAGGPAREGGPGGLEQPDPARTPAAAPVCEWTPISSLDGVPHYSTPHGVRSGLNLYRRDGVCPFCLKAIKFTEAAR